MYVYLLNEYRQFVNSIEIRIKVAKILLGYLEVIYRKPNLIKIKSKIEN